MSRPPAGKRPPQGKRPPENAVPPRRRASSRRPAFPASFQDTDDPGRRFNQRPTLPPYWVALHQPAKGYTPFPGRVPPGRNLRVDQELSLYRLTLSAAAIPHRAFSERDRISVYTPPLYSRLAKRELQAAIRENSPRRPAPPLPKHENSFFVVMLLLLLSGWYAVTRGLFGLFPFDIVDWVAMGAADAFRMVQGGQWYRALTAMTLHGDSVHVLGNILFGSIFMIPVCRRLGLGAGFFLTVLAGALGNVINAYLQPSGHVSIGFSSAVFGAVGLLCALYGASAQRARLWIVLGAGLALLALLGSEGARTDIMAHLFGLVCGFALGWPTGLLLRIGWQPSRRLGLLLGLATALALLAAWAYVLHIRFLLLG